MSTQSPYGTLEANQRNISQCEVFSGMLSVEFKVYYSYGLARLLAPRDMMTTMMLTTASFLNGFKISDIDQLILALIFRFGIMLVKKIGRKV